MFEYSMSPILLTFTILTILLWKPCINCDWFFIERILGIDAVFGQVVLDALKDCGVVIFKVDMKTL